MDDPIVRSRDKRHRFTDRKQQHHHRRANNIRKSFGIHFYWSNSIHVVIDIHHVVVRRLDMAKSMVLSLVRQPTVFVFWSLGDPTPLPIESAKGVFLVASESLVLFDIVEILIGLGFAVQRTQVRSFFFRGFVGLFDRHVVSFDIARHIVAVESQSLALFTVFHIRQFRNLLPIKRCALALVKVLFPWTRAGIRIAVRSLIGFSFPHACWFLVFSVPGAKPLILALQGALGQSGIGRSVHEHLLRRCEIFTHNGASTVGYRLLCFGDDVIRIILYLLLFALTVHSWIRLGLKNGSGTKFNHSLVGIELWFTSPSGFGHNVVVLGRFVRTHHPRQSPIGLGISHGLVPGTSARQRHEIENTLYRIRTRW